MFNMLSAKVHKLLINKNIKKPVITSSNRLNLGQFFFCNLYICTNKRSPEVFIFEYN